jgi:hypothetical protein
VRGIPREGKPVIAHLRYRLRHWLRERVAFRLAWLLPRDVAMWAAIRVYAHATQGKWGGETPESVSILTALQRWDERT